MPLRFANFEDIAILESKTCSTWPILNCYMIFRSKGGAWELIFKFLCILLDMKIKKFSFLVIKNEKIGKSGPQQQMLHINVYFLLTNYLGHLLPKKFLVNTFQQLVAKKTPCEFFWFWSGKSNYFGYFSFFTKLFTNEMRTKFLKQNS